MKKVCTAVLNRGDRKGEGFRKSAALAVKSRLRDSFRICCFRNLDHKDRYAVDAILAALHQMRSTLLAIARVA